MTEFRLVPRSLNATRESTSRVIQGATPWIVLSGLVLLGTATRLWLRDLPNFAPVSALALFAGYYFRSWWTALLVPLAVMGLSDQVLGGYDPRLMAVVYAMLAAPVLLRTPARRWLNLDTPGWGSAAVATSGLVGCSLISSVMFFLVTNFACWLTMGAYEKSLAGIAHCYTQALPFFRYTLLGDLTFSAVLFSAYALVAQWRLAGVACQSRGHQGELGGADRGCGAAV